MKLNLVIDKLVFRIFLGVVTCFCLSCVTQEYEIPTGELGGRVWVRNNVTFDETDLQGVEIYLEGTGRLQYAQVSEDGSFLFSDLPMGTYNLIMRKDGYSTWKTMGLTFLGGGQPIYVPGYLYKLSKSEISNLELEGVRDYFDTPYIKCTANLVHEVRNSSTYRYYLSSKPTVSYSNYEYSETINAYDSLLNFNFRVDTSEYSKGSELYMIAYPVGDSFVHYIDIQTGRKIYTIDPENGSNVASVIIP